jgi:hypothetical protein
MNSKRSNDWITFPFIGTLLVCICFLLPPLYIMGVAWQARSVVLFALIGVVSVLILLAILTQSGVWIVLAVVGVLLLVIMTGIEENRNNPRDPSDSGRPSLPFDSF